MSIPWVSVRSTGTRAGNSRTGATPGSQIEDVIGGGGPEDGAGDDAGLHLHPSKAGVWESGRPVSGAMGQGPVGSGRCSRLRASARDDADEAAAVVAGGGPPGLPDRVIDGEDLAVHDGVVVEGALADVVVSGVTRRDRGSGRRGRRALPSPGTGRLPSPSRGAAQRRARLRRRALSAARGPAWSCGSSRGGRRLRR